MTKLREKLRRADRASAIALLLVLGAVTGTAGGVEHPSTDHLSTNRPSTAQLRGSVLGPDLAMDDTPQRLIAADAIAALPSAAELAMVKIEAEQRCLAEAMYYEARGEGVVGEEAIAEVVFHRMRRRGYPSSICGVVYQGAKEGPACQFSFVCNGELERPKTAADWSHAKLLAAKILDGYMLLGNETNGATSFHAIDVEPGWSGNLERTVQIGNHVFYRPVAHTRAS